MASVSPVARISWGLVTVTCSVLVAIDLAGLAPSPDDSSLRVRTLLVETLAAQCSAAAERNDLGAVRAVLQIATRRNEEVLSAALRSPRGVLLVSAGDHRTLWEPDHDEGSTATHVRVPLFKGGNPWGTFEIRFDRLGPGSTLEALWHRPMLRLLLLIGALCFVAYFIYMRRTLRHLDPSAVIPARVQATLDVMAEGVLLLDQNERIVLANSAFAKWVNRAPEDLMGERVADFDWRAPGTRDAARDFPWRDALRESQPVVGTPLLLAVEGGDDRSLAVNGSPVLDGWGRAKGVIATFDDITELERKSTELSEALVELEKTQDEIQLQNDELQVLATRDPLTGVANRRSFLESFERDFVLAKREDRELSCIMVDIDHFKRVNDNHGHAMGDEVIRRVSEALTGTVRATDAVCRYGGEEFCISLPDAPPEAACMVAERIRTRIESPGFSRVPVTVSLGVASIRFGAPKPNALMNQADEALYASKEGGRNRVTRWDEIPAKED